MYEIYLSLITYAKSKGTVRTDFPRLHILSVYRLRIDKAILYTGPLLFPPPIRLSILFALSYSVLKTCHVNIALELTSIFFSTPHLFLSLFHQKTQSAESPRQIHIRNFDTTIVLDLRYRSRRSRQAAGGAIRVNRRQRERTCFVIFRNLTIRARFSTWRRCYDSNTVDWFSVRDTRDTRGTRYEVREENSS